MKKAFHKGAHTVLFHLYEVLNEAKLIYVAKMRILVTSKRGLGICWEGIEGNFLGDGNVLYLDRN